MYLQMTKKCCVIGAGVSGLTSIKHLLEVGIEPACFEKDDDIGGIWESPETRRDDPGMYSSCIMNTSKEMSCFSDFPFPKDFPNFMRRFQFKRYLDMYADHFGLRKYIQLKVTYFMYILHFWYRRHAPRFMLNSIEHEIFQAHNC